MEGMEVPRGRFVLYWHTKLLPVDGGHNLQMNIYHIEDPHGSQKVAIGHALNSRLGRSHISSSTWLCKGNIFVYVHEPIKRLAIGAQKAGK